MEFNSLNETIEVLDNLQISRKLSETDDMMNRGPTEMKIYDGQINHSDHDVYERSESEAMTPINHDLPHQITNIKDIQIE